jgi:hypothetical protein
MNIRFRKVRHPLKLTQFGKIFLNRRWTTHRVTRCMIQTAVHIALAPKPTALMAVGMDDRNVDVFGLFWSQ